MSSGDFCLSVEGWDVPVGKSRNAKDTQNGHYDFVRGARRQKEQILC